MAPQWSPDAPSGSTDFGDLALLPGLRLTEHGDGLLRVLAGRVAVRLRDTGSVRRMLTDLSGGLTTIPADDAAQEALASLVAAGLTESRSEQEVRTARRATARVLVDAPDAHASTAIGLLLASGVAVTTRREPATCVLVVGRGDVQHSRVEEWSRCDVAHLVVLDRSQSVTVGPFVQPGVTSCLHCVDAHLRHRNPTHDAEVAQVCRGEQLTCLDDPALRTAAVAWAVRDVVTAVEGGRPSTWSATVTLEAGAAAGVSARRREWRRHPDCGCAWAELESPRVG